MYLQRLILSFLCSRAFFDANSFAIRSISVNKEGNEQAVSLDME
ncbi:hypothetical protein C7S13_4753 [Burkholderia cepacia]|nr:hypothetical protein [Burkholderia cepacia]